MLKVTSFQNGRCYWVGHLIRQSTVEGRGYWVDALGSEEARLTLEGMLDDEVEIWGANTADMPKEGQGTRLGKSYTMDGEVKVKGYRWYKAVHTKASGTPVTVHFLGS